MVVRLDVDATSVSGHDLLRDVEAKPQPARPTWVREVGGSPEWLEDHGYHLRRARAAVPDPHAHHVG